MEELTEIVWEPAEINQALRQLPAKIAWQSQKVIEAEDRIKQYKHVVSMHEAAVKVENLGKRYAVNDVLALAKMQNPDLYAGIIPLEKDLAMQEAKAAYFRDMFDSCRKAANVRIEEARRLEGTLSKRNYS